MKYQLFLKAYKAHAPDDLETVAEVLICENGSEESINRIKERLYLERTSLAPQFRSRDTLFAQSMQAMIVSKHGVDLAFAIETRFQPQGIYVQQDHIVY